MTNPSPRPALRKAQDADVHPAAPRPARSPRAAGAAEVPPTTPVPSAPRRTARTHAVVPADAATAPVRRFSGATSDHLRVTDTEQAADTAAAATTDVRRHGHKGTAKQGKDAKSKAARGKETQGKATKDGRSEADDASPRRASRPVGTQVPGAAVVRVASRDLVKGKLVDLDVEVPKELRRAARARAKADGLDLDTVVIDLVHAWLTEQH
jgi:hypothetical protein